MKQRHSLQAGSVFASQKFAAFLEYETWVTCAQQLANGPYPVIWNQPRPSYPAKP
jgi:hypothetical protein